MSLKPYHVLLDPQKVDILRKSGAELSLYLRNFMAENPISSTEGAKAEGSAMEKLSKKVEALEAKNLKMDVDYKEAKNKFEHAYRRIFNAMRRMGVET